MTNFTNQSELCKRSIYQRLGDAFSVEEVDDLWKEVRDRYGKPPEPALWLYHMTRLKVFAQLNGYTLIKMEKLSLRTEQIKGKQTLSRSILIPSIKKPEDITTKVLSLLSERIP